MLLGFIGMPNSGKTTIYNTLTGQDADVGYVHRNQLNVSIVNYEDERVLKLKEIYQPRKYVFPSVNVYDFARAQEDDVKSYLDFNETKLLDATAVVLRNFDDDIINEEFGSPDPCRELETLESEFIISDMIIVEKRLEKIRHTLERGVKDKDLLSEETLLAKVYDGLQDNLPVRSLGLSSFEEHTLKNYQLLSNKPVILVVNTDEAHLEKSIELEKVLAGEGYPAVKVAGKYEMELLKLDGKDRLLFLQEIGFTEYAKQRILDLAYNSLSYIHFYTIIKDEVKAWTVKRGITAKEAAGKIHSDMQKGFIKAECFNYEDLMEAGSEKALKEKGKFRLEGKDYQVKDGDILIIRFNK